MVVLVDGIVVVENDEGAAAGTFENVDKIPLRLVEKDDNNEDEFRDRGVFTDAGVTSVVTISNSLEEDLERENR